YFQTLLIGPDGAIKPRRMSISELRHTLYAKDFIFKLCYLARTMPSNRAEYLTGELGHILYAKDFISKVQRPGKTVT
ncbi:hypothetical protein NL533_34660, partial [Klebsiella pneumoniae]|nr:hypothetical protein [Klebsiella pneumoniae]